MGISDSLIGRENVGLIQNGELLLLDYIAKLNRYFLKQVTNLIKSFCLTIFELILTNTVDSTKLALESNSVMNYTYVVNLLLQLLHCCRKL